MQPPGLGARPYSADDLASAAHDCDLPHRSFVAVNVDGWQMGVGGDNRWGLPVHKEYRLQPGAPYGFYNHIKTNAAVIDGVCDCSPHIPQMRYFMIGLFGLRFACSPK